MQKQIFVGCSMIFFYEGLFHTLKVYQGLRGYCQSHCQPKMRPNLLQIKNAIDVLFLLLSSFSCIIFISLLFERWCGAYC